MTATSAIDLTTAQFHLAAWLAADLAVASRGQARVFEGESLTMVSADIIGQKISYWRQLVENQTRTTAIAETTARTHLAAWIEADTAVATRGQAYGVVGRSALRATAEAITKRIAYWRQLVEIRSDPTHHRLGLRFSRIVVR